MAELPILFSGPMVKAILAGRKTQTRRMMRRTTERDGAAIGWAKLRGGYATPLRDGVGLTWRPYGGAPEQPMPPEKVAEFSPYGAVLDRLWVREAWRVRADLDHVRPRDLARTEPWYCATGNGHGDEEPSGCAGGLGKKRPGIFMPRWASRLTLEITGVRVQQLQEISEEDAKAEGAEWQMVTAESYIDARQDFAEKWDSINGKRAPWASNPWVWAISFRRVISEGV